MTFSFFPALRVVGRPLGGPWEGGTNRTQTQRINRCVNVSILTPFIDGFVIYCRLGIAYQLRPLLFAREIVPMALFDT